VLILLTGEIREYLPGESASHWEIAPSHGAPQSWHTQFELVTNLAQHCLELWSVT
jgi:hypothetical protein